MDNLLGALIGGVMPSANGCGGGYAYGGAQAAPVYGAAPYGGGVQSTAYGVAPVSPYPAYSYPTQQQQPVFGAGVGAYGQTQQSPYYGAYGQQQQQQQYYPPSQQTLNAYFGGAQCNRIYGRYTTQPSPQQRYYGQPQQQPQQGYYYGQQQPQQQQLQAPYGGQPQPQYSPSATAGAPFAPPPQSAGGAAAGFGRQVVDQRAATYRGGVRAVKPYDFPTPYTQGRCKGLFIGINYYGTPAELKGCCNDVAVIIDTLKKLEFPLQEAAILVDDPNFKGASGLPTRDNIIQHMLWLVKDAKAGDCLFFHFSGHGSQTKDYDGDEEDGMDETLVPVDFKQAGMIADDDIFELMVRNLPAGVRMTAIMDCCHSGTLMDLPFTFVANGDLTRTRMDGGRSVWQKQSQGDVVMFSGCSDEQKSADLSNTAQGFAGNVSYGAGGACTNALTMVLTRTKGLSFAKLLDEMRKVLVSRNFKQVPQLNATKPMDLSTPFSFFGSFQLTTHYTLDPGRGQMKQIVPYQPMGGQAPPPSQVGYQPQVGYQQPPPQHQMYQAAAAPNLMQNRHAAAPQQGAYTYGY